MECQLPVVDTFGNRRIFKQGAQFRRERQAEGCPRRRANANAGAGFLFCSLDCVKKREAHWLLGIFVFIHRFGLFGIKGECEAAFTSSGVESCCLLICRLLDQFNGRP